MDGFLQTLRGLGLIRLLILAAIGIGSLAFLTFVAGRLTGPDLVLLYDNLDFQDSSQIISRLETQNIPYELRGDGSQVMVPREEVHKLRASLAEDRLPSYGSVGYEIFDTNDGFGSSNFVNKINHQRALEGELTRTIRSLAHIQAARVHLNIPRRELFSRDFSEPTASIVVKTIGGSQLSKEQIAAVRHIVATAVLRLKPGNISVADDRGNLLARGDEEASDELSEFLDADQKRAAFEQRLSRSLEELLEKSVGLGNAQVQVSADMDFDRISTSEETYDPDGQVPRSTQTVEETSSSTDVSETAPVSVSTNLLLVEGEDAPGAEAGSESRNARNRIEETVNFEISRTVRNHVREAGVVNRLSVAALVNGSYQTDDEGNQTYVARSEEEIAQLTALIRTAIGYDEERGDQIEVANLEFVRADISPDEVSEGYLDLRTDDYLRIGEIAGLVLLGILVMLLVIRPLLRTLSEMRPATAEGTPQLTSENAQAPQIAAPDDEGPDDSMIDLEKVEGRVRASSITKLSALVEKHPDQTVSIIRNWLYQET